MICQNCGNELPEGSTLCMNCGFETAAPNPVPVNTQSSPGKTLGIVSLVLGIISVVGICCSCVGLPFPIAGAVTGFLAFKQAKDAGEKNTLALVGMILSIVGFVGMLIYIIISIALGTFSAFLPGATTTTSYYYY